MIFVLFWNVSIKQYQKVNFFFNFEDYKNDIDLAILRMDEIEKNVIDKHGIKLSDGGKSYTHINNNCNSSHAKFKKIAIVIPYRDRLDNLKVFLNNMHRFLTRQKINYGIYVVEPVGNVKYNKPILMNVGFLEAIKDMKLSNTTIKNADMSSSYWDCFVFHDVDMIPMDERIIYSCDESYPVHMVANRTKFDIK